MEKVTCEHIITSLSALVEAGKNFDSSVWINSAFKLNILIGDEVEKLLELQQEVAKMKFDYMEKQDKRNVSAADLFIETTDEYRAMRKQEKRIDQIEEFVRLAKKQSDRIQGY